MFVLSRLHWLASVCLGLLSLVAVCLGMVCCASYCMVSVGCCVLAGLLCMVSVLPLCVVWRVRLVCVVCFVCCVCLRCVSCVLFCGCVCVARVGVCEVEFGMLGLCLVAS